MALDIDISETDGVVILRLRGKLWFGRERDHFTDTIKDLLAKNKTRIILNMEKIDSIDDSLAEVLAAWVSAKKQGGALKLASPSKSVRHLLEITLLDSVFDAYATEEDALASFNITGAPR